jgi:hypothetical protein
MLAAHANESGFPGMDPYPLWERAVGCVDPAPYPVTDTTDGPKNGLQTIVEEFFRSIYEWRLLQHR